MISSKNIAALLLAPQIISPIVYERILILLFFCSGAAALMYQVTWQRMLFTLFGVDLQSTTIIISVFMFGLGVGGLLGGYIADGFHQYLLKLYVLLEFVIAVFGFLSPLLIYRMANIFFLHQTTTLIASFIVLSIPTILMGMTFPILVSYVNQTHQHIGRSVGQLYFANALGGALGAYFTGFVLFYSLHITEVIYRAACLNLAIAVVAVLMFRKK